METLKDIAKRLNLKISVANTVMDPGKFEQEHIATPYFWDLSLDGIGETFPLGEDTSETVIEIFPSDRETFGFKEHEKYYYLHERSDGFVTGETMTEEQYQSFMDKVESDADN